MNTYPIAPVDALPRLHVIGFTGHRTLLQPDVVSKALMRAVSRIAGIHPRIAGVSSVASGSDTLFAEEMVRRECPISLVLPFPRERFHLDFKDDATGWNRAQALLDKAVSVEVVYQLKPNVDPASAPQTALMDRAVRTDEQRAADAMSYMDAGYRTIDLAETVIAVWDGNPGKGFGGTSYAVAYARALGRPLIIIDPHTGHILEERLATAFDSQALAEMDTRIDPIHDPRGAVDRYSAAVRAEARKHGPRARILVAICLQLYLFASALGFARLVFELHGRVGLALTGGSAVSLVSATVLMFLFGKSHGHWLEHRVRAEVCKSFLATWDIRRHATFSHQPRPAIPGMKELFADLRLLRQMDRTEPVAMDEAKSVYNASRVENQIVYYQTSLDNAQASLRWMKLTMTLCTVIAFGLEAALLIMAARSNRVGIVSQWMEFFGLTLPLVTTSLGVLLVTREVARRTARYSEMLDALRDLQRRLLASYTWDALARVATEVEEELLQEVIEWRSFIRFTRDVAHHH